MGEKLEQVARALYELCPYEEGGEYVDGFQVSPGGKLSWEQAKSWDAEFAPKYMMSITEPFLRDARAAVEAMREPTEAMVRAAWYDPGKGPLIEEYSVTPASSQNLNMDTAYEVWQAMIDEILK